MTAHIYTPRGGHTSFSRFDRLEQVDRICSNKHFTMILTIGGVDVDLPGVSSADVVAIEENLRANLANPSIKGRVAIAETFRLAISRCPDANASDLWHHVIYRAYLRYGPGASPSQSWVRASGDAFESWLADTYNTALAPHGKVLAPLFSGKNRTIAIATMGLASIVSDAKLDLAIYRVDTMGNHTNILGGIHAKASLAERVSDDIPASRHMMKAGFASFLVTLDVKSFPPPHGDLVNRGELGTPASPSAKRDYIEKHGEFTNCYSYNDKTAPSLSSTVSGRKIYVTHASDPIARHRLFADLVAL